MKISTIIFLMAALLLSGMNEPILSAQDALSMEGRVSIQGGVGISGARGDYPSEYDARVEFSFNPGLRLRLEEPFLPDTMVLVDLGFLKTGFIGYVSPTDTYFYNSYEYVNMNAMLGAQQGMLYFAGGLYFGIGTASYSYKEYEDKWVSFDANPDFGLIGEVGAELTSFLSLGVQSRFGLKSIGSSVDIKNFGLLATVGLHFYRF